ncbi:nuclear transport factor 2 family protein [Bacillus salacetis]|uniref:nuclear transport factor 2 family protein n=1 Tax=Bacillus salacetis TaxID=2315464 RepID=UPI003BA166E4
MKKMSKQKETAVSFLQMAASGKVREAFEMYTTRRFFHHNAYFKGDAETIMIAMQENAEQNPNKAFEVKRTIEEGDTVAVHSHVKQNQGDTGAVVVHIFRFEEGKIVEMWDIGQPIPSDSPNEHGVF